MKALKAVAFLGLSFIFLACAFNQPEDDPPPGAIGNEIASVQSAPAQSAQGQSGQAQQPPSATVAEAPVGLDNASNGLVDAKTHQADQAKFETVESVAGGLGPLFNGQSCSSCHQSTVTGGGSQVAELRVGHKGSNGQFQTPEIPINHGQEVIKGRSLVNQRAICPSAAFPDADIQQRVPDSETIRTLRISNSTLGSGFVEALEDATLQRLADKQCKDSGGEICGLALRVPVLEAPGQTRVGRFGWKNQHASLLSFSADAYLNEIGVTSRLQPDEVTNVCNTASEPNDKPGANGQSDIDIFARYMRATKAPSRDTQLASTPEAQAGQALFSKIGCASCHVPTLQTAAPGTVVDGGAFTIPEALGNKVFHPYSDYLLHDVGTGDGVPAAMAEHYGKQVYKVQWRGLSMKAYESSTNRMRTAPLWGLRTRTMLMHDGLSLTLRDAIARHRGEASSVTSHWAKLSDDDQNAILQFLNSL
jgi:CxxC motif-containing protein (DUF1111 family)